MCTLLANTETVEAGFLGFPPYFGVMLLGVVVVFALALVLFALAWRVVDWITPGKLNEQLVPRVGTPNVALAIVVGSMLLGLAMVLSSTIHAVLTH
jgi:uncharacterized membrane protein YjfL (UPF0719 family)